MSQPMDYFWEENRKRTIDDIRKCAMKQQFSCEHQPQLDIPLENVVLDELHLMLRVTGKELLMLINVKSTLKNTFCKTKHF